MLITSSLLLSNGVLLSIFAHTQRLTTRAVYVHNRDPFYGPVRSRITSYYYFWLLLSTNISIFKPRSINRDDNRKKVMFYRSDWVSVSAVSLLILYGIIMYINTHYRVVAIKYYNFYIIFIDLTLIKFNGNTRKSHWEKHVGIRAIVPLPGGLWYVTERCVHNSIIHIIIFFILYYAESRPKTFAILFRVP